MELYSVVLNTNVLFNSVWVVASNVAEVYHIVAKEYPEFEISNIEKVSSEGKMLLFKKEN